MNINKFGLGRIQFYIVTGLLLLKLLLLRMLFFDRIAIGWVASDAAPVLLIMGILYILTPLRIKTAVFWTFNVLLSILLFASSVYFNHFGSVPTYLSLYDLDQVFEVRDSVGSSIMLVDYLFFADIVVFLGMTVLRKWRRGTEFTHNTYISPAARRVHLVVILVAVIGGLSLSSYSIHATRGIANELVQAESAGFLNYEIVAAVEEKEEKKVVITGNIGETAAKVAELESTYNYNDLAVTGVPPAYFGSQKGKNVIVIQMEAFQNFALFKSLGGQEITPVLNKLAKESMYFSNVYQQIGPGNTSDAEFMSNTSIYPIGSQAMSSTFGDRVIPSLPRLLRSKGYEAYTFHVNKAAFWNRRELYPALGFTSYFDQPYFKNDHINSFGASDEQLYITGLEKLSEMQKSGKPFYAQFITVASHHPFKIPKAFRRLTVPDNLKGQMLGDYLTAINYTDYAIGTMIDGLKKNGLWDNSIVVFYGDHFGLQPKVVDPAQIKEALGVKYDNQVSRYNIPLIVHNPGMKEGQVIDRTGGQVDIMPTLTNLLGISLQNEKYTTFGHDLLNIDRNVIGMRYYLPTGSFFNNDILYVPGKGFSDGTAVSLKTLEPVTDFSKYEKDYTYIKKLMRLSDEYMKLLPTR